MLLEKQKMPVEEGHVGKNEDEMKGLRDTRQLHLDIFGWLRRVPCDTMRLYFQFV